jgi:hypothetical protein
MSAICTPLSLGNCMAQRDIFTLIEDIYNTRKSIIDCYVCERHQGIAASTCLTANTHKPTPI